MEEKYRYKIIILGEANCGKSSCAYRFINEEFPTELKSTVGIDFYSRNIIYNDEKINLIIWDSAGQERFGIITKNYIRNINGIILMFDLSDIKSFERLNYWLGSLEDIMDLDDIPIILVGNKCDMEIKLHDKDLQAFLDIYKFKFMKCSAKNGYNINNIFYEIVKKINDTARPVEKPIKKPVNKCC